MVALKTKTLKPIAPRQSLVWKSTQKFSYSMRSGMKTPHLLKYSSSWFQSPKDSNLPKSLMTILKTPTFYAGSLLSKAHIICLFSDVFTWSMTFCLFPTIQKSTKFMKRWELKSVHRLNGQYLMTQWLTIVEVGETWWSSVLTLECTRQSFSTKN